MTDTAPRPWTNPDLTGQEAAEAALLKAWKSGRLAHAWLITGPRGIGKATLAYRFARFVLSQADAADAGPSLFGDAPPPPDSLALSPDHPVFQRVAVGSHGDLLVADPDRVEDDKKKSKKHEIPVDRIRQINGALHLSTAEGGWRVVIVDAAEDMNRNAANALLKSLEEPPPRALMLLISHSPGRLLPTIRSRCRSLALSPLPDGTVEDLLARYAPETAPGDRLALVRLAEGSIGKALDLQAMGGVEQFRALMEMLNGLPRLSIPALHAFTDKMARADDGFRLTAELLVWWLGRMIAAGGHGALPPEIVAGEGALMVRLHGAAALDRWVAVWEKITQLFARTEAVNLDKKQALLSAFLSIQAEAR